MALFQKSVLSEHLKSMDDKEVEEAYAKYKKVYGNANKIENIKNIKEEQYQGGFFDDIFVKVLGYTRNPEPEFNLTTELKNIDDAKKADGAILVDNEAIAVIELKSTATTDFKSIEQQAFNYKNHQPKCEYVITSNFHKLRLYIENATDFEEFDLFNLDLEKFRFFYLCLSKDNILSGKTAKLKKESYIKEEDISLKLYKDYSAFKNRLFDNLIKNNPEIDKVTLLKKSQKLLDRFLFIFFAEDRQLIPANTITSIINEFKDMKERDRYEPLYDTFKIYFNHLNTGSDKNNIPEYNGGLFAPDDILDNIKIDDDILVNDTLKLSKYDFISEIDANILGHIFENSLSDIEELHAKIDGVEFDKSKTKRKKDGVFYTPKYITKYIVENTIGSLCEEKKRELKLIDLEIPEDTLTGSGKNRKIRDKYQTVYNKLEEYQNYLLSLKILDPACGSGAFLIQALDFLISEHKIISEAKDKITHSTLPFSDIDISILENNLYGVDINDESVEIAKLSLWLHTAIPGRKLSDLSSNIKCGNSLIDDPDVAGDKAFDWDVEFAEIMGSGGFDVVIGNPPYVFARDKISQSEKDYYNENYVSAEYQVNTYLLFIEKTINLIKEKANYGLIVPNAWLMISSAKELRKYILGNCKINEIINLAGYSFEGVNVETIIILASKDNVLDNDFKILLSNDTIFKFSHLRNQNDFYNNDGHEFKVFSNEESLNLTKKIKSDSVDLDEIVQIKAGLQAYEKGKGDPKQSAEDVKNRPYDYNHKFDETTYKYLDGRDVNRYFVSWTNQYLKYGKHLAAPRTFNLFKGKKIIIREITGKYPRSIISTYSDELYLYNRSNIGIVEREDLEISLKYIVLILNSKLMAYYFVKNTAKSVRQMFPKVILNDLRKFPFKNIEMELQKPFIDKADIMLELNSSFQKKKNKFLNRVTTFISETTKNDEVKLSKNISSFYESDFTTFVKELKKKKVTLSLKQQDEWEDYFEEYKKELVELKIEIDKTDTEIDKMVYELYGLTDEEIGIVEGSV